MPRTSLAVVAADVANIFTAALVTWTAADVANGNQFALTGKQQIWIRNTNASSPLVSHTVTIYSTSGASAEFTIAGSAFYRINPLPVLGFVQSGTVLWINADSSQIQFAIVSIP